MCHAIVMIALESLDPALYSRLIDNLYVEAMVMADEARAYFDREDMGVNGQDAVGRLFFTCESLKVTTRLMHVIAWLLTQKAWRRGEISADALAEPKYRLGPAAATDPEALADMPSCARELVTGSEALYDRVRRLQESMMRTLMSSSASQDRDESITPPHGVGPARDLLVLLERSF